MTSTRSHLEPRVLDADATVLLIPGLLSDAECVALIDVAEGLGFDDAPVSTEFGALRMPHVRDNTRVMIDDPDYAARLWERVAPCVPGSLHGWTACGLNERLRFYRYEDGQRFRWHRDGCFARSSDERSLLTLLIYLNDRGLQGGATEFMGLAVERVHPVRGQALVFEHPVVHQGAPVTAGRKYVLRTDVLYRR